MKLNIGTHSLQTRLLLWVSCLATSVWISAAVLTWYDAQQELDELLDAHLAQTASLLVAHERLMDDVQPDDERDDGEHDSVLPHKYAAKLAFQIFHEDKLVSGSGPVGSTPLSERTEGFESIRRSDGTVWRVFATLGHERDVRVLVAEQVTLREDILWAVLRSMFKPLLAALPLLVLAIWWAVHRGLRPLHRLGQTVASRQPDATQALELTDTPQEVQSLVTALNELFERIHRMMESEKRFTADAAHELRTPIAAIKTQVQVAMGAHSEERHHALTIALAGCDRATRLVEQLLTLARLEATDSPQLTSVNLSALVRQLALQVAPSALARGQTLELEAHDSAFVWGDETLLGVLVRNLLDNALRYSPDMASIHVSVAQPNHAVVLLVQDSGPGMTTPQIARLGERFYRVLGSDQPGSGLGWSIVQRIASAHQAQVQVDRSERLAGLAVKVTWPVKV